MEMIGNNITGVTQNIVTVPANHIIVQQLGQQPVQTAKFITTALNVNPVNNAAQPITLINSAPQIVPIHPEQINQVLYLNLF